MLTSGEGLNKGGLTFFNTAQNRNQQDQDTEGGMVLDIRGQI